MTNRIPKETIDRWIKWVHQARTGDPVAWNRLLGELRPWIVRWVAFHCKPDLVEDVVQEVLLRVHLHLHQLEDVRKLVGWVHMIAVRQARAMRGGKSRRARETVHLDEQTMPIPDPNPGPQEQQQRQERIELVHWGISKLPELHQNMLRDRMTGMSIRELSLRYSCPVGTVKRRLHEARQMMRRWLAPWLAP